MIYPLTAGMLAAVFFLGLALWRFRRLGLAGLSAALVWLWLWSMPAFGQLLVGWLEAPWEFQPVEEMPVADAIVILGGGFHGPSPSRPYPQLTPGANRYWYGARLFHANRGDTIILSGGTNARNRAEGRITEAESGARFLLDMDIPLQAMLLDTNAMNTRENAVNIAEMLESHGLERFILVTSASHMRRSVGAFRALGLEPIPAAGHFRVDRDRNPGWRRWLPSESGAALGRVAFHELVGYKAYGMRGWVDNKARGMSHSGSDDKNDPALGDQ